MLNFNTIPERMYEAAFLPELWTPLLDEIAEATGSGEGGIGIYWPEQRGVETSTKISSCAPWMQKPDEVALWLKQVRSGPYLNAGFFQLDPFKGDWSELPDFERRFERHKQRGLGVQTGTILEMFNGEIITLEFSRRLNDARYDEAVMARLKSIDTAFRHTALFASRLNFERARASIDTLDDLGLPAALISPEGQVFYANTLFDEAECYFRRTSNGQLTLRGPDTLRKSFALALEKSARQSVQLALPLHDMVDPVIINFMPMCGDARSIFALNCTVMMLNPVVKNRGVPSPELVGKLFGLTPAEARLATTLSSGLSLRDSAAQNNIGLGTARSYLVRVFSKTETSQQSELVSLLKSIRGNAAKGTGRYF